MMSDQLENPCQEALTLLESGRFELWQGLPANCSIADMHRRWGPFDDSLVPGLLGQEAAEFTVVPVSGYDSEPRVWVRDEHIVLIDIEYPELTAVQLTQLGQPAARLDTYWHQLLLRQAHWVYPERGLSLLVNPGNNELLHLTLFTPTTVQTFEATLLLSLRTFRLRPSDSGEDELA